MSQPTPLSGAESSKDDGLEPPRYGERVPEHSPAPADAQDDRAATTWAAPADDTYAAMALGQAAASNTASTHWPAAPDARDTGAPAGTPLIAPTSENVVRGLLFALIVIPVGAAAWVLLWQFGFIASIVSFGIAWGAVRLYRIGSRGAITRGAFWGIVGIIVVALVVSMLAAIASDVIAASGLSVSAALASNQFWAVYWNNIFTNGRMWAAYLPSILMMLVFGALGCFSTVRRMARESRRVSS